VSLDNADSVIEGGPVFGLGSPLSEQMGAPPLRTLQGWDAMLPTQPDFPGKHPVGVGYQEYRYLPLRLICRGLPQNPQRYDLGAARVRVVL
jgi:hypothetical protein